MMKKDYIIPQMTVEQLNMGTMLVQVVSDTLSGSQGTAGDVAEGNMRMIAEDSEMAEANEELW